MGRWLKMLRWLGIAGAVAGAIAGVLLLAGYAVLQTESGRARLVELLNRQLSTPGSTQVRIGRLEGDLPGRIEIRDLRVDDAKGTWLRLAYVSVRWKPAALFAGTLRITKLDANGLTVLRRPEVVDSGDEFHWPELPMWVSVEHFSLDKAELASAVVGDPVAFTASGDTAIEGPDRVVTTIAVERTDGISGQARAQLLLKPRSKFLDFQFALNEADGGLLARAMDLEDLPSLSMQVDGKGPISALHGNATLRAGDRAFIESTFTIDATKGPAMTLAGSARIAKLVEPPLREFLADDLAFAIQGEFIDGGLRLLSSDISNQMVRLEASGELVGLAADFDTTVTIGDLQRLGRVAELPLQGQAIAHTRIRSDDLRLGATASASASLSRPLSPGSALGAAVGPDVAVSGTFEFDADKQWAVRDLSVTADAAALTANGTLSTDGSALDGEYRLVIRDLRALSGLVGTALAGELTVDGEFRGSSDDPTMMALVSSPDLAVDAILIGPARARVDVEQFRDGVRGTADASVDNSPTGAVTLSSRFAGDAGDRFRFDGLTLESRDGKLEGSMAVDLNSAIVTGALAGRVPLAPWSELAGQALSGHTSLALDMGNSGEAQRFDVTMKAGDVRVALSEQQSLLIGGIDVSARIDDVFGTPQAAIRAIVADAKSGGARFDRVALEVKVSDPRRAKARLQSQGEFGGPFELEVVADYGARERGSVITISKLAGSLSGQAISLVQPARFEHDGESSELSESILSVAGGKLTASGRVGAERIEAEVKLRQISLAAVHEVAPFADVSGALSGHLLISGTRSAPTGKLDLEVADVRSSHSTLAVAAPATGRLRGDWHDGRLQLSASLSQIADTSIDAQAGLPLLLEPLSLALSVPAQGAIDGALAWSGDLGPVWDLLSPYEDRFTGPGDIAITLAGTADSPTASGHFRVTGGHYENVQSGTTLTNIELGLAGNGDKLTLEKLNATDGKRGTLSGGGIIEFDPSQRYPTDLRLNFSDILLIARDDLILNASGDLALQGTLATALLSGSIVTGQSELSLAGTLPPEVVELQVDEVNVEESAHGEEKAPAGESEPSIVILDLDLSVPGRAFVRGLGLESEWKGDLKISGNTNTPNVAGVLNPVRGHFALLGKRFRLERGDIRFTGSDDVDPLLDLTAEHQASSFTALVRVTGSASRPKVLLTSRPPLPESEIASQVLFGTDSNSLSAGQSLQLASAIATYSGKGGAVGILDATRRALGVDVINFAESEQDPDKTRVSVGKYVADGVYIEVERGAEESSRVSTTVEVEVMPDVRIEGGTTETGGNKVGVKWKWDY